MQEKEPKLPLDETHEKYPVVAVEKKFVNGVVREFKLKYGTEKVRENVFEFKNLEIVKEGSEHFFQEAVTLGGEPVGVLRSNVSRSQKMNLANPTLKNELLKTYFLGKPSGHVFIEKNKDKKIISAG